MFEGMPLPISPLHVYALPLWICAFGMGATALLRVQFDREWALTMWTAYQIKRVWQRLADESARTGGTLTSHAMGMLTWALLGSLWGSQHLGNVRRRSSRKWSHVGGIAGIDHTDYPPSWRLDWRVGDTGARSHRTGV